MLLHNDYFLSWVGIVLHKYQEKNHQETHKRPEPVTEGEGKVLTFLTPTVQMTHFRLVVFHNDEGSGDRGEMCKCTRAIERNDQKDHFGCNVEDGLGKEQLRTKAERPVRKLGQQS